MPQFSTQRSASHILSQCLTYGVFMLVCVDASVHDPSKKVIHDAGECLCVQHTMQGTYKHGLAGVQTLGWAAYVVTVRDHPGNDLHLNTGEEQTRRH